MIFSVTIRTRALESINSHFVFGKTFFGTPLLTTRTPFCYFALGVPVSHSSFSILSFVTSAFSANTARINTTIASIKFFDIFPPMALVAFFVFYLKNCKFMFAVRAFINIMFCHFPYLSKDQPFAVPTTITFLFMEFFYCGFVVF